MPAIPIGIYLAAILSTIHFTSTIFIKFTKKHMSHLLSFSAGVLLSILFLELFPEFSKEAIKTNFLLFLLPLMGFVAFHSIRSYNFRHIKTEKELKKRHRRNHILAFFMEHFILGFALTLLFKNSIVPILLFVPFALLTISSSVLLHIINKTSRTNFPRLILGSSTLLGAVVGTLFSFNKLFFIGAFGYAMGALFYIVARDIIPLEEKDESTIAFFIGLTVTSIFLLFKGVL